MKQTEFTFENSRSQQLLGVEFLPDLPQQPWATLIWHHGVCDHCTRHTPVFQHMADAGVAVYTFDVHGHGRSEPKARGDRGLIKSYSHLLDDLSTFIGIVEQRVGHPLLADSAFLGGQSMGGLVIALAVLKSQDRWAGAIMFSGAIGLVWTPILRIQAALGNLLSMIIPRVQAVPAVKPEYVHPDPAVVQSFEDDPLVLHGLVRVKTANELLKAIQDLAKGVSSSDLTLKLIEGGYHDMLTGDERTTSADGILAWMKERAGKPRGGRTSNSDVAIAKVASSRW